ncbi:MAG: hypothetical protein JWM11_3005 [Planctomycetaceae bacterium]|nr:hypothetical protein [Planctomycetaceae bacterium]
MWSEIIPLIIVLVFVASVLLLEVVMITRARVDWEHDNIVRLFGLTFIIGVALALAVAKISGDLIAAVMGLLGTVAGYFLGQSSPIPGPSAPVPSAPVPSAPVPSAPGG